MRETLSISEDSLIRRTRLAKGEGCLNIIEKLRFYQGFFWGLAAGNLLLLLWVLHV